MRASMRPHVNGRASSRAPEYDPSLLHLLQPRRGELVAIGDRIGSPNTEGQLDPLRIGTQLKRSECHV